jgi:glycine/D-amino acid oxidase-like deaminating enzyme
MWWEQSLRETRPAVFWLDRPDRPEPRPRLVGTLTADLAVVGGGFSGLWTALRAKERDPSRDVVLLEAGRIGSAASGRNGGFCAASLTHGARNGRAHFPREYPTLERLGLDNLEEIDSTVRRLGIDCAFERTGELSVATEPYQVQWLRGRPGFLDADAVRAEVASPTYLGGIADGDSVALVDPARLAWGLASAAEAAGVRIAELTPVTTLEGDATRMQVGCEHGEVRADRVAVATGAFRPLLRRIRFHVVPVYDYVLVTEPLSPSQLGSIGWRHRQGVSDLGNQFHYYRLTEDDRILWGGYDAVYHYGRRVKPTYEDRPRTFELLAQQFFETFPQLEGLSFTHRWGGAIDTCTRFCAFFGTARRGRVAYAMGYTGLGVGASRFGADVMLDLLDGRPTARTELEMVSQKALPFPPEPLAYLGVQLTRWSLARADLNNGRRNLWLRGLDRLGVGFDS